MQRLGSARLLAEAETETPMRAELFSADQMQQHGSTLAGIHQVLANAGPDRMLQRLDENESLLLLMRERLAAVVAEDRRITPAGVWLLDNADLIEEQIRLARKHLPKGYSRELPRLALGASIGLPRVYDLAMETIAHSDGRIDLESLVRFIDAYQAKSELKLGELWAIPIMLRLALIENLRRAGARTVADQLDRDRANTWAAQMLDIVTRDPKSLILVIADMARSDPPMSSAFVAELTRQLGGQSAALALALTWIEQRLAETGVTIERLIQAENHQQAADQVSISNSIGSLRLLAVTDWRDLVERTSRVERILLRDPAGAYGRMDFATRDRYRHQVERIARRCGRSESEVALGAIGRAGDAGSAETGKRTAHVGFHLIGPGLPSLLLALGVRSTLAESLGRGVRTAPLLVYVGAIVMLALAGALVLAEQAQARGVSGYALLPLSVLLLICTSHLAVALVNWFATLLAAPHELPRLDFAHGIPVESRTLVVVPTMLGSASGIAAMVEALEVRFLANQDAYLHFALLTDFLDASEEMLPGDEALSSAAANGIAALNQKYARSTSASHGDRFFLLHRPRRWNAQERLWMGFERKRGKLEELNALLRGGATDRFSRVVGAVKVLQSVRYVITLDSDTALPRDSARQLVGAMAHPLNQPLYDPVQGRVTSGYGILQPRVEASLSGGHRSRYARMSGGEPGIDPYTQSVSDVYQDLFGEGSFVGKGIYDVDAFEQALGRRFPENRILSHDLLEGCHARAGLLSDVQLYEDYPARYSSDAARRHRWIRGDWQLLPWLWRRVPGREGAQRNPLSHLSRWKILDNLRRSLVPMSLTLLLLLGWSVLAAPLLWTLAVLAILTVPALLASLLGLLRPPDDTELGQQLAAFPRATGRRLAGVGLTLACLPFEAQQSLDAILRTVWRMAVSRTRLLEWRPSHASDGQAASTLPAMLRLMWSAPLIAGAMTVDLFVRRPDVLVWASPILLLWLGSPVLVTWLGRPSQRRQVSLSRAQELFLRRLARRTWSFFETHVGADDHHLPPDNVQEIPATRIAHRTSPTNIGLSLLANLSAHDFGYIGTGVLIERTAATMQTLQGLKRHRGHFYNWYDTQTLQVLSPPYVSTVDSGNLAGHLLALGPGLLALIDAPLTHPRWREGLEDTLALLADALAVSPAGTGSAERISAIEAFRALLGWRSRGHGPLLHEQDRAGAAHGRDSAEQLVQAAQAIGASLLSCADEEVRHWTRALESQCRSHVDEWRCADGAGSLRDLACSDSPVASIAVERIAVLERLALQCRELARMEYRFLYDRSRHLLHIGYHVEEGRLDPGHYDLLASEARLCNFVAIAQGQLPEKSWFALGRRLTTAGFDPILVSWSGSMFEYLMPLLVMPAYADTLLDQTCRAAVQSQMDYGRSRGVPWGISESGYNGVDSQFNYQYRAFGVPGLGLKRGLAQDLVVAPYASVMALMVAPAAACSNLQRIEKEGFAGRFGMFEAIDYTPSRLPPGQTHALVRSFMSHHQGMSFMALAQCLLGPAMQMRFAADPEVQATLLLLQEKIPKPSADYARRIEPADLQEQSVEAEKTYRSYSSPNTPTPEVQLLSNGRYHVMVSNAGGSSSRWQDLAVSRWREDTSCDNGGAFCYLRDVASGKFWSVAHQPTLARADSYEAIFSESRAEFRRRDGDIESHTEIVVSPEDDIELRRVRIANHGRTRREIELTSYAEVVLAHAGADASHPAFSNLFVQTEWLHEQRALLCKRRPRSIDEATPCMFHLMVVRGTPAGAPSFETDRLRFIGRGNTTVAPAALRAPGPLSDTVGSVLDPVVAIRSRIVLEPGGSVVTDLVYGVGSSREQCLGLIAKYDDRNLTDRVFELAWTHNEVMLRQINASAADARLFSRLAAHIIYSNAELRAPESVLLANRRGQSGLWGYSISGDLPIVLLQIQDIANMELVRLLVRAHHYWRLKGLAVDLVIWNEDHAGYRQLLHEQIMGLVAVGRDASAIERPGGVFVRHAEQISHEDRVLLRSVARIVLADSAGTLAEQLDRLAPIQAPVARLKTIRPYRPEPAAVAPPRQLILDNGLGGFTADAREYIITTRADRLTPAPWVNVLANAHFGTLISESGGAYTWGENAREFRLTPWHNDPVSDIGGEALYLRDEENGQVWSPTALPCRGDGAYVARHGFGYSVFEHTEGGISSELTVFVALDAPVKFSVLKLRNASGRARRLSATGYVEWLLGDLRSRCAPHVSTFVDSGSGALFARNPYNTEFASRVTFFDVDDLARSITGDRTEFLGRNGTLQYPAALKLARLSGRMGAGLDPCAAIQVPFDLADGEERQIIFRLGVGRDIEEGRALVKRFRELGSARKSLAAVWEYWKKTLDVIQIDTPDPALNALTNGWLIYQTLACRLWGRSGYYQSGGAFGYRDQLQDTMALVHAEPALVREHLLRCAQHQFPEGDVLHWWHPPTDRGVRTTCSDDYLWLPLAICRYVTMTGDTGVLDETLPFIEGRLLNPGEESNYDLPVRSNKVASLYEHGKRAVLRGLQFGERGLPLMGSGDWNDGMNKVGEHGRGESIWLGFFLYSVLLEFADLAQRRADETFAQRCREEAATLQRNLERGGWDGQWYRRAYFDDGTPLGSSANAECQIDSIAQSWSVLSGAGDPERTRQAMNSLDARLVRRDSRLIQLLDPPFDQSEQHPGYIRGYVPGVRENGGQYTHSAIWAAMAFARLGDGRRAWELTNMINPVTHARTPAEVETYKVEPYVMAADLYGVPPHTGRGGWTWYTGSAGWMYRLIVESLLGCRLEAGHLRFAPCLPEDWKGFSMRYRHYGTTYHVEVVQESGEDAGVSLSLDGSQQGEPCVRLVDDGVEHRVEVRVRRVRAAA
ncbi:MAG: GH36-type glycosyl hydrolase domain-containing protein [Panacagrimonas sp.]